MAVSVYDDYFLSDEDKRKIEAFKAEWSRASEAGDEVGKQYAHNAAEEIRANAGYSGGADGSGYEKLTSRDAVPVYSAAELPSYTAQTDAVSNLYDAASRVKLSELESAYNMNMATLQDEKSSIPAIYQEQRDAASSQSELSKLNFNEYASSSGINSGTAGQAELSRLNTLQSNLSALGKAEASAMSDVNSRISRLKTTYQNDVASAIAGGEYEKAAALLDEYRTAEQSLVSTAQARANENYRAYSSRYDANNTAYQRAMSAEDTAYQRALNAENTAYQRALAAENTAYERKVAEDNTAYSRLRDALEDERIAVSSTSSVRSDEFERQLAIAKVMAQYGDFSGFQSLGISGDAIERMKSNWLSMNIR